MGSRTYSPRLSLFILVEHIEKAPGVKSVNVPMLDVMCFEKARAAANQNATATGRPGPIRRSRQIPSSGCKSSLEGAPVAT